MLRFRFFDVQHGSCTHIQTPNGRHFLLDIGGNEKYDIPQFLHDEMKVKDVDYLIITHPHIDHIREIDNLCCAGLPPKRLLRNSYLLPLNKKKYAEHDEKIINRINDMHIKYKEPIPWETNPINPNYNGGVSITILSPNDEDVTKEDFNTASGLYVFGYGGKKVVLTGDNNKVILEKMVKSDTVKNAIRNADFLLAPHHGRDTDFCQEFFDIVNPLATIISDKEIVHDSQKYSANFYGGRGIKHDGEMRYTLTTRKDGNISLCIDERGTCSTASDTWEYLYPLSKAV